MPENTPSQGESITLSAVEQRILARIDEQEAQAANLVQKRDQEIKDLGAATEKTAKRAEQAVKNAEELREEFKVVSGVDDKLQAAMERIRDLETKANRPALWTGGEGNEPLVDATKVLLESERFQRVRAENSNRSDGPIEIPINALMRPVMGGPRFGPQAAAVTTSIVSGGDLFVPATVMESPLPSRPLRLRDLIGVRQMTAGEIRYIREIGFHDGNTVSISSMTQTSGIASVTTATAHGLNDGDRVRIAGADQSEYNGVKVARTTPTSTTFTFQVDSGAVTPSTGTRTAQNVQLYGAAGPVAEGGTLPEASFELEEVRATPERIGHWIPVTREALADDAQMRARLEDRLPYGILFAEDAQLLLGDGTGNNLQGIASDPDVQEYIESRDGTSGDTKIDSLRRSMTLGNITGFPSSGVVIGEYQWEEIEVLKGSDEHYILMQGPTGPSEGARPRVWRQPLVVSHTMPSNRALVGAFGMVANVWVRENAEILIADQHADYAIRNQVAMIAEERVVLENQRPEAFVYVTLDGAPA